MKSTKEIAYKNILVIVAGLLVFYIITNRAFLMYTAAAVGLLSALVPPVARFINWLWMKIAFILGWINSRVLLGLIFYVFLFPIALISRLFTKDPLKIRRQSSSIYVTRNHLFRKEDLENTW